MRELPSALRWYLWAIYLACASLIAEQVIPALHSLPSWGGHLGVMWPVLFFVAMAYAGERGMLEVGDATWQSLATAAYVAAILLFPPPIPLLIALAAVLAWHAIRARAPLYKRLFNVCHTTLLIGCSSLVFSLVAIPTTAMRPDRIVAATPALALLLVLYYALDVGVMVGLFALLEHAPPWRIWVRTFRRTLLAELAAGSIGILAAVAWLYQPLLLTLFVMPIVALRTAFRGIAQAQRRSAQLEAVLSIGQRIRLQQTEAELLRPVAETARALVNAATATAYVRDAGDPARLTRVVTAYKRDDPDAAHPEAPARLDALAAGRGMDVDMAGWDDDEGERTLLVPLEQEDVGLIGLLRLTGFATKLDHNDRDILSVLATQTTIALQNARLHEGALARASEDSLTGLLNHRALQVRLEEVVARARRDGRALALLMVDLDDFGAINNTYGHQAGDTTLTAVAAALREGSRATDVAARYGGDEFAVILPETGIEEALGVAERVRATIMGLRVVTGDALVRVGVSVGVASLPLHASTREELIQMADRASYAAKHSGKGRVGRPEDALPVPHRNPAALAAQLEHANMATVEALAAAVDAKDRYTHGHSQRVSTYAAAIAYALGLSPADVARVRLAGLLHDVGKIGVPDAILAKPSALTCEEIAEVQQHPVIGERMLMAVPFLREILAAVRSHHERPDGRGYPDRLRAAVIPRDAAILMVADSFDAMTSNRPYRPALPVAEARLRLRDGAGAQFEPSIVTAFERALNEGMVHPQPILQAQDAPR